LKAEPDPRRLVVGIGAVAREVRHAFALWLRVMTEAGEDRHRAVRPRDAATCCEPYGVRVVAHSACEISSLAWLASQRHPITNDCPSPS
jgi:hypothetical protein